MNREVQRIIKKNQYRSKFYQYYKKPTEREKVSKTTPIRYQEGGDDDQQRSIRIPFQFQLLLAILLLVCGMIIKKDPKLEPMNEFVFSSMNIKRIEARIINIVGTIFPTVGSGGDQEVNLPVISLETIEYYRDGVLVKTDLYYGIESHVEGTVIRIKKDKEFGDIIVIQDIDGNEWEYGMLTNRRVNIYDRIHRGELLGMAKTSKDLEGGEFYLAIKNRSQYVDVLDMVDTYD